MIKDSFGTEVNIGDEVAFVVTPYKRTKFNKGILVGVSKGGGAQIRYRPRYSDSETTTTLQLNRFIKLNPPKPVWQWLGTHETSSCRK